MRDADGSGASKPSRGQIGSGTYRSTPEKQDYAVVVANGLPE